MDFGLVLQTDPPAREVVRLMKDAEDAGFRYGWTFDSCVLWQEPFVIYSQILSRTSNVKVGPMVTNPLSRELSVTASLFATLNDMFGNRTVCGIGRGDSGNAQAALHASAHRGHEESSRAARAQTYLHAIFNQCRGEFRRGVAVCRPPFVRADAS